MERGWEKGIEGGKKQSVREGETELEKGGELQRDKQKQGLR